MATVREIEIPRKHLTRAIRPTAEQFIRRAREVAAKKGFQPHQITFCIDGVQHSSFGRNKRFVLMQDRHTPEAIYFAKKYKKGTEVLPAAYLGSAHIKGTNAATRYVHFVVPTRRKVLDDNPTNPTNYTIRELLRRATEIQNRKEENEKK
ncbi:MAG: hypothetical protein V1722_05485 [Candidatus Micrarchaeota archaeon]